MIIKTTYINSQNPNLPSLILIPGGPGLSSLTLRSLDSLSSSFNLIYVDFPGCNDNPYIKDHSFDELSSGLIEVVNVAKKNDNQVFVLGHSFGGFFAADIALKTKVEAIICIATPFSSKSLHNANDNYENYKSMSPSKALAVAEGEWLERQDDKSLAKWFSEYGALYFKNEKAKEIKRELILKDKVSAKFFIHNRADAVIGESLLTRLRDLNIKKFFIAGTEDGLLDLEILKEDAVRGKFEFHTTQSASHFVMVDDAGAVLKKIEIFIQENKVS